MMLSSGGLLLWFTLTALATLFVVLDIRTTPAHPVLRWAFVILTVFGGPVAAFFYVLGCREPLRDTHEKYVSARWRQVLGSTMHCAAGDGIGIIAGAALARVWGPPAWADLPLEYALGFGFGWLFFQAYAMRDMAGGSYRLALKQTFWPEFLSMNVLMAGMLPAMSALTPRVVGGSDPRLPGFWFVMSIALIAGFVLAYPINWWLVAKGLKHGMITVGRPAGAAGGSSGHRAHGAPGRPSRWAIAGMALLTATCLAAGVVAARALMPA